MSTINLLDSDTINKIAAGEVVERPSSVVKELVENAIDAKATAITVEIKEGGISYIRITDNGSGIEKDDVPIAFYRHSTSKIRSAKDLLIIASLGFRGEALSSIAAVSQVEMMTKTSRALTGIRYKIEGGVEKSMEDIGCPQGTTFIIRNLFYNTPARRKFLKTAMTEAGYISDLMQRMALSHPEISFKFINNGQTRLHTTGNMRLKDIIYNVYGRDITANVLEVSAQTENVRISGFIGKPLICRGNRTYENYFINGRYIKSGIITKAIEEAYKNFIMVHKYPLTVLHLTVDTSLIDVNVHPSKMEIRFNNGEEMYKLVYHSVREALEGKELIPEVSLSDKRTAPDRGFSEKGTDYPEPFEAKRREAMIREHADGYRSFSESKPAASRPSAPAPRQEKFVPIQAEEPSVSNPAALKPHPFVSVNPQKAETVQPSKKEEAVQQSLFDAPLLSEAARPNHRLIGQVFETYWIVEYDGQMFIIDQHAAHEKVLYEKLYASYRAHTPSAQYLEPPLILTLSIKEETALKEHLDSFKAFGFEIEAFGGNDYAVRAVPMELYGFNARDIIIEMIDQLSSETGRLSDEMIADHLATAACKAAVKGNHRLSFKEADALIDLLLKAENPYTCPHGRPTIIAMSKYELEKKFKRIQ